jgi:hypothetical protein
MFITRALGISDLHALTGTLVVLSVVCLLLTSGAVTEEALAASGVLTEFTDGSNEVMLNFTKIAGGDNTDYSLRLPKQSNVIDARLDLNGEDYFIGNQIKTYKSAYDFRQGSKTNLIFDTDGLHLDMDTLAPFWPFTKKTVGTNAVDIQTGDFNDDNRDDFVVCNYDSDSVTVWWQDAQGKFSNKNTYTTSDQPKCVDRGDFNNDGLTDFAVGTYGGKTVDFFYQKSTGGFTRSAHGTSYQNHGIATGDFNGDGLDDVALAPEGKVAQILRQKSTGGFETHQTFTVGETGYYYYAKDIRDVAAADFDGDGDDDLAYTAPTGYTYNYDYRTYGKVKFYYQGSNGLLSYRTYIYSYTGTWNIAAGDFTGDGRPDIVYSQRYVNKVKAWTQTAGGGWSGPTNLGGDGRVYRLEVADFDGDNKNDVVAGSSKPTLLFWKQAQGKLSTSAKKFDLPASATGQAVAAGNLNNDAFTDAVTADGAGNSASIFKQRLLYDGNYVSEPIKRPLPIRYVNFTYEERAGGGETDYYFSTNGGLNWTPFENGVVYDLVNRTDTIWYKVTFSSSSAARYNSVKFITLNMTYQSYPADLWIDLGRDGNVEWNNSGELIGSTRVSNMADAITEYVQNSSHPADSEGYVTIPVEIHTRTPGTLTLSDIYILYNNASRRPTLVFPQDRGFVNATPTFRFYANDTDDDRLKYKLQITKTDFNDLFNTETFDMTVDLYDDTRGEGFPEPDFPQGVVASFTLPFANDG